MRLHIRYPGHSLTEDLAVYVDRQLRFALRRFADRVARVDVTLRDQNGPKGGVDQECKIHVQLTTRARLRVKETRDDAFAAVALASDRIAHAIGRHVDRIRRPRRARASQALPEAV